MPRAPDFRYRPRSRPMSGPVDPDLQSTRNIGARAGSRTLNLGIRRLRAPSVSECLRVSGSLYVKVSIKVSHCAQLGASAWPPLIRTANSRNTVTRGIRLKTDQPGEFGSMSVASICASTKTPTCTPITSHHPQPHRRTSKTMDARRSSAPIAQSSIAKRACTEAACTEATPSVYCSVHSSEPAKKHTKDPNPTTAADAYSGHRWA